MTHGDKTHHGSLEGLARLLETYGAGRSRWPARDRLEYSGLIASNSEARRLLAEAEALDALLDRAAGSGAEPSARDMDALAARIMAAAGAGQGQRLGTVTPMRPGARSARRPASDGLFGWPAAAMLAASLALGVFAGTEGLVDEPMQAIAAVTSPQSPQAEAETDEDASQLALGSDEAGVLEEELL